jgi:hypothetical protein
MRKVPSRELSTEARELRRAIAKSSLRNGWLLAKSSGLDSISEAEIDHEITEVRTSRMRRAEIRYRS